MDLGEEDASNPVSTARRERGRARREGGAQRRCGANCPQRKRRPWFRRMVPWLGGDAPPPQQIAMDLPFSPSPTHGGSCASRALIFLPWPPWISTTVAGGNLTSPTSAGWPTDRPRSSPWPPICLRGGRTKATEA
ncbi:hypothetical protein D1007_11357 [Hordeum vulgare]|nr:hypothetical protein D1007_11357 [Hordeum vulgare]